MKLMELQQQILQLQNQQRQQSIDPALLEILQRKPERDPEFINLQKLAMEQHMAIQELLTRQSEIAEAKLKKQ